MKYFIPALANLTLAASLHAQGVKTTESPYLLATPSADFTFEPVITVGDRVPVTPGTAPAGASDFAFCGIPDATGIYKDRVSGENILFVAHELGGSTLSTPFPGVTYQGAWISRFVMSADGGVVSGSIAHRNLYEKNTLVGSSAPQAGAGASFTRFCSGSFAGKEQGLDRPVFLTNEESSSGTYDSAGPQVVAVIDGAMHTLPDLGRVTREVTVVQPRRDAIMAVAFTEDGPATGNVVSYVYMYVGTKRRTGNAIDKNGLGGGKIYVLAGRDAQHNEGSFSSGSLPVKWVEIPNAASLNEGEMSLAADNAGGFGFVRVEDGEFDPTKPTRSFYFSTTGGSGPNPLGRLYEITLNPTNPVAEGSLNVVYNASNIVTPGGTYTGTPGKLALANGRTGSLGSYNGGNINNGVDFPVSIDNIAISKDFIVICEDTNSPANAVYAKYGRNSGLWTLDRNNGNAAKLQSTFNYAYTQSRDGSSTNSAGRWESTGATIADSIFGPGTFVVHVQGHLQSNPSSMRSNCPDGQGGFYSKSEAVARYAEDGQVLIMRPAVASQ